VTFRAVVARAADPDGWAPMRENQQRGHPQSAGDEAKTTRTTPVVILQPAGEEVRAA
jgi:hypothetical protein